MAKTADQVCTRALRKLGVTGIPLEPDSYDMAEAKRAFQGILDELRGVHGGLTTWTATDTPDQVFLPLADLVANEIAPAYGPQKMAMAPPRSRALGRVRAYLHPNDIADERDADEDGTISEAEEAAGKRAAYY